MKPKYAPAPWMDPPPTDPPTHNPPVKHTGFDNVTAAAQRAIEEWQNPPDCAARRYLLWRPNNFGIGSDLHTIGLGLAWAMDTGRVLLYHPETCVGIFECWCCAPCDFLVCVVVVADDHHHPQKNDGVAVAVPCDD